MLHPAQVDWYRHMTPRQRWRLSLDLMDAGWETLRRQGPEAVARAREEIARSHRESVRALLEALKQTGAPNGTTPVA